MFTSRLRDVLALTVGLYLIAVGILFAIDSTGLRPLGTPSLVEGAAGLALVALGILSLLAAMRARRFARRLSRAFGHVRSAGEWRLDDAVVRTVVGDIHLDLRSAELPEGETELALLCWLGTIQVRVPAHVGLDVEAQTFVGTVDVLGVREEGVIRDIDVRTEDYETATHRLKLRLSTVIGELLVVRSER
ncbi:MAG: cell wall-active antibiotics response protein LiaF [Dehalococcoidia bacterium]|nr:cell wall-active antibiotics response protein LiaF [Dehalococcoidia bacterium]